MAQSLFLHTLSFVFLASFLPVSARLNTCPVTTEVSDQKFVPGQVWSYKTRANETGSTITVLRVDTFESGIVRVHVRIAGLHMHGCGASGERTSIAGEPFSRDALERSVTQLQPTLETSGNSGRESAEKNCGFHPMTVAEFVSLDERDGCST